MTCAKQDPPDGEDTIASGFNRRLTQMNADKNGTTRKNFNLNRRKQRKRRIAGTQDTQILTTDEHGWTRMSKAQQQELTEITENVWTVHIDRRNSRTRREAEAGFNRRLTQMDADLILTEGNEGRRVSNHG